MSVPEIHQLFEPQSSTYTYVLIDPASREAVVIDPVLETAERDLAFLREHGAKPVALLETHLHADHITGAAKLRAATGAPTAVSVHAGVEGADRGLRAGDEIRFGACVLRVLETPGHTDGCLSFLAEGAVFTGDALLIGTAGRTDFQGGSAEKLYRSITRVLFALPGGTVVYPGHDYKGLTSSTVADEIRGNARAGGGRTEAEFVKIMSELNLPRPKRMDEAVPANRRGGAV